MLRNNKNSHLRENLRGARLRSFPTRRFIFCFACSLLLLLSSTRRVSAQDDSIAAGKVLRLPELFFELGKATPREAMQPALQPARDFLVRHPELFVEIGYHTENRGSDTFNLHLSEKRAALIRDTLIAMGVPWKNCTWKGYGECCPLVAPKATKTKVSDQLPHNQRAEMKIIQVYRSMNDSIFNVGDHIITPEIIYDDGRPKTKDSLEKIWLFVNAHPELTLEIGSHTDTRGSDNYNVKLSALRAKMVYDFLLSKGAYAPRLLFKGYGETQPLFSDAVIHAQQSKMEQEAYYRQNRRTELKVIVTSKRSGH